MADFCCIGDTLLHNEFTNDDEILNKSSFLILDIRASEAIREF